MVSTHSSGIIEHNLAGRLFDNFHSYSQDLSLGAQKHEEIRERLEEKSGHDVAVVKRVVHGT
jgi:hypothetical protein